MSFWAGINLESQVVLLIDRFDVGPSKLFKFQKFARQKFIQINSATFFLPAGCLQANNEIAELLKNQFGHAPVSFFHLLAFQAEFKEKAQSIWEKTKPLYGEDLKRIGYGLPNLDSLLGGIDSQQGKPFLVNFNDKNNFDFRIFDYPAASCFSPIGPPGEMVKRRISQFLGKAMGKSPLKQREIAREELGDLIPSIAVKNPFVSPMFDTIFVGKDGSEIYQVEFLRGVFSMFWEKNKKIAK